MTLRELAWRAVNAVRTRLDPPAPELPPAVVEAVPAATADACWNCDGAPDAGLVLCGSCLDRYKGAA